MLVHVVAEGLVEQEVELAVVAEDDVAAVVPREAGRVDEGRRRAARDVVPLVDHPVVVPEPRQLAAAGETARPAPTIATCGARDADIAPRILGAA